MVHRGRKTLQLKGLSYAEDAEDDADGNDGDQENGAAEGDRDGGGGQEIERFGQFLAVDLVDVVEAVDDIAGVSPTVRISIAISGM
jgi:hypothetical protein